METINTNSEIKNAIKVNFKLTSRKLRYAYISSIPIGLDLVSKSESRKPNIKGVSNGFRFYFNNYNYVSAGFNMHDYTKIDYSEFQLRLEIMFSTLQYLNERPANALEVYLILKHIKENSRYHFKVREMYIIVRKFKYIKSLVQIKSRDYDFIERKSFKRNIDFLNEFNNARRVVNSYNNLKDFFRLIQDRIVNNDYEYMSEAIISGHKNNNLLIYALIRKFNLLSTGLKRKGRKFVNSEALYDIEVKRFTLKSKLITPQDKIVFMQNALVKCEQKMKVLSQLIINRQMVHQMFLITQDLSDSETDLLFVKNNKLQKQLRSDLMNIINRTANKNILAGAKEFDKIYKKPTSKIIPLNNNLKGIFDGDLKNSIFNQLSLEEAQSKGDVFFGEFMKFHNKEEIMGTYNFGLIKPN